MGGVNYLAHQYLARAPSADVSCPELFRAGNLLPDLMALYGAGRLRSAGDHAVAVAEGVRFHLATDRRFHASAGFKEAQGDASEAIRSALWEVAPRRRFFLAHVMTELALDAALLKTHGDLPDELYNDLTVALDAGLVGYAEALVGHGTPGLGASVRRFIGAGFLRRYATPEGLATALRGVSERAGIPNFASVADQETLAALFSTFAPILVPRITDLLGDSAIQGAEK